MQIPDPITFFTKTPLYTVFDLSLGNNHQLATDIYYFSNNFDAHCLDCGKETTYQPQTRYGGQQLLEISENRNEDFTRIFHCTRNQSHRVTVHFKLHKAKIIKTGLFPSIADLSNHEIKKYKGVLDNESYNELSKAIGLVSHGVGIGSFVYLRRIFESLVEEAHKVATKNSPWDEDQYCRSRMDEKVLMLKNYLPEFLIANRSIYSILSLGIHSLDEQTCLDHFEAIKVSIELILDKKIEKRMREEKVRAVTAKITSLTQRLKSNASD
jgi:hypothetical protein